MVDGGPHCLLRFTQHSGGDDLLQRFQWLQENKGRSWESQPGTPPARTRWPFKSGQRCVPRVFNGGRERLRKTLLYMLFSIAAFAIVLSLLPDRSPETGRRRGGGGRGTERGLRQERGVLYPKRQGFGAGVSEYLGSEGGWGSALQNQLV